MIAPRAIFALALALWLGALVAALPAPAEAVSHAPRASALHLLRLAPTGEPIATCAATAIGPHRLRTAVHCVRQDDVDFDDFAVNGRRVRVLQRKYHGEKLDIADLTVDATFAAYARPGPPAKQGDEVYFWGHAQMPFTYRRGFVSNVDDTHLLVDALAWQGDSGSGVFDMRGRLVGTITHVRGYGTGSMAIAARREAAP